MYLSLRPSQILFEVTSSRALKKKKIEKESDRNKREIDRMKWNETKDRDYRKRKDRKNKINEIKEIEERKEMKEIKIGGRKKVLKGRGEKEIDQGRE